MERKEAKTTLVNLESETGYVAWFKTKEMLIYYCPVCGAWREMFQKPNGES
jgi:hypothetical protein